MLCEEEKKKLIFNVSQRSMPSYARENLNIFKWVQSYLKTRKRNCN